MKINSFVQSGVVGQYKQAKFKDNKIYPSLEVVRLEKLFFNGKKGKILDYGIGGGCNAFHFSRLGYEVTGADISPTSIKMVKYFSKKNKLKTPRLYLINPNKKKLPLKKNTFDYIICISVLSLLGSKTKVESLLSEFKRILKPGGKIIIDINDHNSEFSAKYKQIKKNIFLTKIVDKFIRCYCLKNQGEFKKLVSKFLKVVDSGYSSHKIFNRRIREFIICAKKSDI